MGELINFLRNCPATSLQLIASPRALVADLSQFEPAKEPLLELDESEAGGRKANQSGEELEDPLLELLRRGAALQQDEFLAELQHQRSPVEASV